MGTLEEEIKQSVFKNVALKALLNIMYTANWIRDNHTPIFKEYGILQQHYNVLRIVKGRKGDPVSPGQIIKVMLDKGRDLTRLVDKLVKLGYLVRNQSPINKRRVDINITEEGARITDEIEIKINKWINDKIKMDDETSQKLSQYLDQLRNES